MADNPQEPSPGADGPLDEALGAAFKPQVVQRTPASPSVLSKIAKLAGIESQVHLRDVPDDAPPVTSSTDQGDGRYQIVGEIARGGMGTVLKARDPDLGRDVAMKVLSEQHLSRRDLLHRFVEEAQIGGQLQHPGIVPVYELGMQAGERPYFTMKLLQGQTLAALLRARRDPGQDRHRCLRIFQQVCQTMAYAHARGVIHRDLKPSNIMVGTFGEVQVIDWGLSKVLGQGGAVDDRAAGKVDNDVTQVKTIRDNDHASESMAGSVLGTPAYMPPEQARGEVDKLDERSDVFSLGAILCEILTGKPPYLGKTTESIREKAAEANLKRTLARLDDCDVDDELIRIAQWVLEPEKQDRPKDAGELAGEMTAYLAAVDERVRQGELEVAAAEGRAEQERKARRLTLALATSVLGTLLLAAGGAWFYQASARADEARITAVYDDAVELLGAAREGAAPGEIGPWQEARNKVQEALAMLRTANAGADLWTRVTSLGEEIDGRIEEASAIAAQLSEGRDFLQVLARTQFVLVDPEEDVNHDATDAQVDDAYTAAFAHRGLFLDQVSVEDIVTAFPSPEIAQSVAAHLDNWASSRRWRKDLKTSGWQELLRVAMGLDPDPWRKDFRERLIADNIDDPALIAMSRGADLNTLDPRSIRLLTAELTKRELWDPAIEGLQQAREVHSGSYDVAMDLAFALEYTQDYVGSLEATSAAVALNQRSPDALMMLGIVNYRLERWDSSIAALNRAITLDPDYAHPHIWLGSALWGTGQLDAAVQAKQTAVDLDPAVRGPLATTLADRGFNRQAVAELRTALQLPEASTYTLGNLGILLVRLGSYEEALEPLNRSIELEKHDRPYLALGDAQVFLGNYRDAARSYGRAVNLGSTQALPRRTEAERFSRDEPRLLAIVQGDQAPEDSVELLYSARFASHRGLFAASAQLWETVFEEVPGLMTGLRNWRRDAIDAAAKAGLGLGKDAEKIDENDRTELRLLALYWLNRELDYRKKQMAEGEIPTGLQKLGSLFDRPSLAGLRESESLAKLPHEEAVEWKELWNAMREILKAPY